MWWCWWCSYWYFEWKYRPEFYSLRTLDKYEVDRSKITKSENKPKTHQFLEETDVWASFPPLQYTAHSTEPLTWHFKHSSHLCVHSTKLTRAKKANFAIYNMLIGSSLCKRELKTTNRIGRNNSEASSYCSLLLCLKKPRSWAVKTVLLTDTKLQQAVCLLLLEPRQGWEQRLEIPFQLALAVHWFPRTITIINM